MKWSRFQTGDRISFGIVEDDGIVEVSGSPFEDYTVTSTRHSLANIKLLAPVVSQTFYAAGPNYRSHLDGMSLRMGTTPSYPTDLSPNPRATSALVGHEANIVVPSDSTGAVQPEGQLAVIIGKKAKHVSKEEALDYVFGYTIGNDVSQRPWQWEDHASDKAQGWKAIRTLYRGKNPDTFKPLGPWIVTDLDPAKFHLIVRCNGEVWEDFYSSQQIWDVPTWIEAVTKYMTLLPGDMIWMGTYGADGDMFPGDVIEVEVSDIGVLRNYVVAEE